MKANEAVRVVREELPGFQPGRLKTALETVLADSAKATEMVAQLTGREIDLRAERDAALGDRGEGAMSEQEQTPQDVLRDVLASSREIADRLRAERDALRDKLSSTTEDYIRERNAATAAEAERDALWAERDALRATLREIEQATEGIPEANCALANRIARVALAEVK